MALKLEEKNISMQGIDFGMVTNNLGLGEVLEIPAVVTGGLLHKMYRVVTEKGIYAVKVLNEEIMTRPQAYSNTVNSERIAAGFQGMLPVVAALEIDGKQIHEFDGRYYMIFPWMEGKSVFVPQINAEHCKVMGEVLGRMHAMELSIEGVEPEADATEFYDWDSLADKTDGKEVWKVRFREALTDIKAWNRAVCDSAEKLNKKLVISHRDLDPKNVMWNDTEPLLIDWEAAGYVNPYQELLEVINYWTEDGKGGLNREYFDALTSSYQKHMGLDDVAWDAVFAGSYAGMLGWLEYNVKRALGLLSKDVEDIYKGEKQVIGTIKELYHYQQKTELLKDWLGYGR